jgi:hypothetical protein
MRKAAISIMPACLVVALGGLFVTPSVAQVAEPPPELPEGARRRGIPQDRELLHSVFPNRARKDPQLLVLPQ